MNGLVAVATIAGVAMLALAPPPLAAQTVYRCGTEYRAEPCVGGTPVRSDDLASSADRLAQGRAVAAREKKLADEMSRDRRAREAVRPGGAASVGPARPATDTSPQAKATLKPKKAKAKIRVVDEKDFVATVPTKSKPR
jgi:hypothetical protein